MFLHYPVTLNASTYTLRPPVGRQLTKLVIQPAAATVYVGPTPKPSVSLSGLKNVSTTVLANVAGLSRVVGDSEVTPGMLVSHADIPANTYVVSVLGGSITLSAALTGNVAVGDTVVFSYPPVNATTGVTVLSGGTFELETGVDFAHGVDVYCAGSTAVKILYALV